MICNKVKKFAALDHIAFADGLFKFCHKKNSINCIHATSNKNKYVNGFLNVSDLYFVYLFET